MDVSRNYSKQVIKPAVIPRLLRSSSDLKQKIARRRESNENQENLMTNHMSYYSSKLQNPEKPPTPRQFVSSRRKILVDRNDFSISETTRTTHVSEIPVLDSKTSNSSSQIPPNRESNDLVSSRVTPIFSNTTNSDEEPPYDPKTDCLSPKPEFLSSNPIGRVNILERKRNELKQRAEQESEPSTSRIGTNERSNTNKGSSSEHESEAEIEEKQEVEEKNGRSWILHQVFKFLVLLGFVGFSAFYISSMNAPNPPFKQGVKILWKFLFKLNTEVDDLFTLFHLFRFHNRMHKYM
ncbi:hypothetical protein C5167_017844 [Papaver somniferum]|uniref:Uncharacterized protein n=1 Tax=Papaver somniferum TaxID=3469 RepID=A0A4Y7IPJ9_PAPSO|nr:uncharacterized protein LOC113350975 [Papaver somniferum]RZC49419.1 hypothetical protein C5167_017844 [Papaver somniferum]